jgi:lipopolysaccharide/colanic/teichoic acid biosynthesis glycosyltransferase
MSLRDSRARARAPVRFFQMDLSLARSRRSAAESEWPSDASASGAPLVYRRTLRGAVLLADLAAVTAAFGASYALIWRWTGVHPGVGTCVVAAFAIVLGFAAHDLHEHTFALVRRDEFYYAAAVTGVVGSATAAAATLLDLHHASQLAVLVGVSLAIMTTGLARFTLRALLGETRLFVLEAQRRQERRVHVALSERARLSKRLTDLGLTLLSMPIVLPLLGVAMLAIALEDGAPVIYRQARVGQDGRAFSMFKLRSMRVDAEEKSGPVWALHGDARTTRVGRVLRRFSIDELPQLFNVLRGEMSIVGPRPERPVFTERFSQENPRYPYRLAVAPGLTAFAQLYMPRIVQSDQIERRLDYDLLYVRHRSLVMDVALIIKTAAEVVFHRAA